MSKFALLFSTLVLLAGCSGRNERADAYGNFEAREYLISAEGQGKILGLEVEEGSVLPAGKIVGCIDTMPDHLQERQLQAQILAVKTRSSSVGAQIDVLRTERKILFTEKNRLEKLLEDEAATGKQLDDLNGKIETLDKQILSAASQYSSIRAEIKALEAQKSIVADKLQRNMIVNPVGGTVLEKYVENFEVVAPGKSLYKIADLSIMILRVYVSGDQLASLRIGQDVGVIIDDEASRKDPLPGKVTWISDRSEFTPKIIQTREERVNLVYAVKVEVPNDGRLKIGMPGEVVL